MPKNLKMKIVALSVVVVGILSVLFMEFLRVIKLSGTDSDSFGIASLIYSLVSITIIIIAVVIIVKMMLSYQKNLILLNEGLSSITDNIPGGMVCCKNNPKFEVSFVSDSFVEMTGYTKEDIDIKFDGEFFKMVFPSDRKKVEAKLRDNPDESVLQYRMIKSDGATIWIYDKGKLVGDGKKGGSLYYRVLTDITDLKTAEQALMKSKAELNLVNERYRMVLDQSNYIVFDIDLVTNAVTYSSNYEKKFGMSPSTKNFPASFVDDGMVHPDDIKRFLSFFEKVKDDSSDKEEEIRIRSKNGGYSWYNICVSTISGEHGTTRAIGRMADITRQRSDTTRILTKNQIDEKTGLMNMQTAFDYIGTLTENDKITPSALMLIGLSEESEEIIPEFASRLRDLFRSTDILGYTDENKFIVFMKNCNKQLVERRSFEILSVIAEFSKETEIYGNIGVSLFPRDSEEIMEIYKKAQLSLVHSENKKRSGYTIYEEI